MSDDHLVKNQALLDKSNVWILDNIKAKKIMFDVHQVRNKPS